MFDIKDFYPSIKAVREAIRLAKRYLSIPSKDIKTIFHASKSVLYYNDEPGVKIGGSNFAVTMGAYDRVEVCKLIGIFMLSLLSKHIDNNHIELYRDDGFAILKNTSGPAPEKLNKKFQKLFKEKDLNIIVQCNLKIINNLDITLNLNDGS